MFPKPVDTFVHGIRRKTLPNHEVLKTSLEYLNRNAIQRLHIVQRIPALLYKDVHAMIPSYSADAQLAIAKLRDNEGIALRSKKPNEFEKRE